ncbi:hypothetical protein [Azospirillum endophyticum]
MRISTGDASRHPYKSRFGPNRLDSILESPSQEALYPYSVGAPGHFCCPGLPGQAPSLRLGGTYTRIPTPKR